MTLGDTMNQRTAAFRGFLDAVVRADADALAFHLAENVVLNTPIAAEPIRGRAAVVRLLMAIGERAEITVGGTLTGADHLAAPFQQRIGETTVNGMDYACFGADDKITELTAFWRPLPAIIAMQEQLAPRA